MPNYKTIEHLKRSRRNWIISGCIGTFLSCGIGGIIGLNLDHTRTLKVCTDNAKNIIQSELVEGIDQGVTFTVKGIRDLSFLPMKGVKNKLIIAGPQYDECARLPIAGRGRYKAEINENGEEMIKIGDKIKTPNGWGIVNMIEVYSRLKGLRRYCIKFPDGEILCYWAKELKDTGAESTNINRAGRK